MFVIASILRIIIKMTILITIFKYIYSMYVYFNIDPVNTIDTSFWDNRGNKLMIHLLEYFSLSSSFKVALGLLAPGTVGKQDPINIELER